MGEGSGIAIAATLFWFLTGIVMITCGGKDEQAVSARGVENAVTPEKQDDLEDAPEKQEDDL